MADPRPGTIPSTEAETELVAAAHRFAAAMAPQVARWEQAREAPPRSLFARYGAAGFAGLMVPRELGGQGASFFCKIRVAEAMARTCFAATFALNNTQGTTLRLAEDGTPAQRERYLPGLLAGTLVCAPSLTEPGAGSDAAAMTTLATKVPGGWRIDGAKSWITNGVHADLLLLYAQTRPGAGAKGIASFLLDLSSPGVGERRPHRLIGGAAAGAAAIDFRGVFVPDEALAAPPGEAFKVAMRGITAARVHVASMVNGVVAECLERAVAHAGSRRAFGRALMEHQGLRWSLAEVSIQLEASRLLTDRAAILVADGKDAVFEAAQAKAFATTMAVPAISACMQAMGAEGLTDEQPFARHLAAARIAAYVDGTTEVQLDRIGALLATRYAGPRGEPWVEGIATQADAAALAALINAAYRPAGEARGWTDEGGLLEGPRIDAEGVLRHMATGRFTVLRCGKAGPILACAHLAPADGGRAYVSLIAVDPAEQGAGLGAAILAAAEAAARGEGHRALRISVIAQRESLVAWYRRRGFVDDGVDLAFPYGDPSVGRPLRDDLSLVVMEKPLG